MKNKIKCIINSYIALFKYIFDRNKKYLNKEIWLFGGHGGDLFEDNARAMFEYVLENKKNVECYWIINENSSSIEEIEKCNGKYLIKGSVENYLYFYKSKVVIFSHSMSSDIAPYSYILPFIRKFNQNTLKVFTSHGVEGFKKKNAIDGKFIKLKERILKSYDIFISAGNIDKNIKINEWEIDEKKIKTLGMPRYDKLNYKIHQEKKKILYMPTWRNWLVDCKNIEDTEYYNQIKELITNKDLINILEKNEFELNIYIHHLMHKYIDNFRIGIPDNVKLLPTNTNLQREIIESKIIITDYSSIAWDAFYMNKSIIFFRFDMNKYEREIGSYINLNDNSLGSIVQTIPECIEEINRTINKKVDIYLDSKDRKKYFEYEDFNNCRRYIELIESYYKKNKKR